MKHVRKTYVEFLGPDYIEKRLIRKVESRDPSKVKVQKRYFGFRFFDIFAAVVDADGKKVKLTSLPFNVSSTHYWGDELYTIAEFKCKFPDNREVIRNVKYNRGKRVIL